MHTASNLHSAPYNTIGSETWQFQTALSTKEEIKALKQKPPFLLLHCRESEIHAAMERINKSEAESEERVLVLFIYFILQFLGAKCTTRSQNSQFLHCFSVELKIGFRPFNLKIR